MPGPTKPLVDLKMSRTPEPLTKDLVEEQVGALLQLGVQRSV